MIEILYICDGEADGCRKSYCKYNGMGDCAHTTQREHARYKPPREFTTIGEDCFVEKERADD